MGIILLFIIAIVLIVFCIKKFKQPNSKKIVKDTGEEIYRISKIFLSTISTEDLSDSEVQRIMTFIEGFSRFNEKEQKYRKIFEGMLGSEIMATNPHIYIRIKDKDLDCFIYSNKNYALSLDATTKALELSKIK